ncbi:MAG: hypothetical protein ABR575_00275 [Actinomycetota bacterium]
MIGASERGGYFGPESPYGPLATRFADNFLATRDDVCGDRWRVTVPLCDGPSSLSVLLPARDLPLEIGLLLPRGRRPEFTYGRGHRAPNLGHATTKELIDELAARAEVSLVNGEQWPSYRRVDRDLNETEAAT